MKKVLLIALGATFAFTACKKNEDTNNAQPKARVMFVNAAMDVGDSLRVQLNNQTLRTLPFRGVSGYVQVDPGATSKLSFVFTGSGNVFQETTMNLTANNAYSVFAGGDANIRGIVARTDDLTAPAAGKVKVRLVHLATGSLVAEGTIGDTINIATNLSFAGASDFREVNAGTYTITAGDPGKISSIRNLPAQALASGKIYTFLYSGSLTATGTYELNISRIDHN